MKILKRFIVRKYIYAKDAKEAIRKDKKHPVEDVWIDEDWKKEFAEKSKDIGFNQK